MTLTETIEKEGSISITSLEYMTLDNPVFEGQTCQDSNGFYTMYFSKTSKDGAIKYYDITQNIMN